MQINDSFQDKFELIISRLENIVEEYVTHEKMMNELEKYTRVGVT